MAGPKRIYSDRMHAKFVEGTFERIAEVLLPGEDRTEFVRQAANREIEHRNYESVVSSSRYWLLRQPRR